MHRLKVPLTVLLIVVVLADVVVGYRLWESGWPKSISLTSSREGVERVEVIPILFTASDWLILGLVVGIHGVLFYTVWRAWHSSPIRV